MSGVTVVYAKEELKPEYFAYQHYVLMALHGAGANVIEEEEFLRCPVVGVDDKLVGFFLNDANASRVFSAVVPQNRWSYAIDERARPDGRAYVERTEFCRRHDISHMVVTYENEDHLRQLRNAGIECITMPCCVPRRRQRTIKPHGVFAVGTFDPAAYTTRFRVRNALLRADNWSGRVVHQYIEPAIGDAYYDTLEQYQLGITCRVDYRDRMVQKYVEFGMCHVLPIGDCPTYMPHDMRQLMVNVEGMNDQEVVAEVQRLLRSPEELRQRQEAYSCLVHERYDLLTNVTRIHQIIRG